MTHVMVSLARKSKEESRSVSLSLESQRAELQRYADANGLKLHCFETQCGHGEMNDEIEAAISMAELCGVPLHIVRADRLPRNKLVQEQIKSRVRVICTESPTIDPFMLDLLGSMSVEERRKIQARTTAALSSIKARIAQDGSYRSKHGRTITKLGGPLGGHAFDGKRETGTAESARVRSAAADRYAAKVRLALSGFQGSASDMARKLNMMGVRTRLGSAWTAKAVRRVQLRIPS
jgi:DNA invertase Pin-like site-specific DNA recombinase